MYKYNQLTHRIPFGAVHCEQNVQLIFPVPVTINASKVVLVIRKEGDEQPRFFKMFFKGSNEQDSLYYLNFTLYDEGIYWYRFEVHRPDGITFVGRGADGSALTGDWLKEWQLTVTEKDFLPPKQFAGGLIYHIFADRFYKEGDIPFNKKGRLKQWKEQPDIQGDREEYLADDFYGGNLAGIQKKLPYLKSLGVTLLYLSPIFESSSNHRYDTGDYMKVDDLLGGDAAFDSLLRAAKRQGMGIILDGVFNHAGWDSRYFNRFGRYDDVGAYQSEESLYYDWFTFSQFPQKYDCWWGMTCVPAFDKNNANYRAFLFGEDGVIAKWTAKGIAGWRLDVVDELPIDFTTQLSNAVKVVNPNAMLIGEVWEDASTKVSYSEMRPYFLGQQLDGVMNYVFKKCILDFVLGANAADVRNELCEILNNYPKGCLDLCMTLLDSHDTVRIINVLSGVNVEGTDKAYRRARRLTAEELALAKRRLKLATVMQYTVSGMPTVYYGDEVGLQGFEDPLNRRPFPWDDMDEEILAHYRALGAMRTQYRKLFRGSMRVIKHSELLVYERLCTEEGEDVDDMLMPRLFRTIKASVQEEFYPELDAFEQLNKRKLERLTVVLNNKPYAVEYNTKKGVDVLSGESYSHNQKVLLQQYDCLVIKN